MKIKKYKNYCKFYIVRHGETAWNVEHRIQGQKDSPLTKNGINQAKSTADVFKEVDFDKVYSSDLLRAKRTAELIALEKELAVNTSKLLRERLFGRFQGKKYIEFKEELKEKLAKRNRLAKDQRFKYKLSNDIESDEELVSRLITFLRETAVANEKKNILIVTHGGTMRILLIHLGWAEYEELPSGAIGNTGYIILESDGTDFYVKTVVGIEKI